MNKIHINLLNDIEGTVGREGIQNSSQIMYINFVEKIYRDEYLQ